MVSTELAQERRYVEGLYTRLDALRAEARTALERVRRESVGGNHQSRSERDAYARLYEDRIAQLDEVDDRLAFGRLELVDVDAETAEAADDPDDSSPFRYIGRIGLRDEQLRPILLDWRVPQAAAFYQATAATPLGARARRHLITEGRTVTRIDDEIFDAELLVEQADSLQGEAALLAALTSQRTGRMSDIVATIQAEQDRIIRSELGGVLVVQGGPGTGKTAVALHRAAYLLYSHRERLASSGVLVVGPSRAFLQYIEAVLPSLGETGVVVSSVGGLYPGLEATHDDAPETAQVKGAAEMAALIKRAVRSRQRVPAEATDLEVNGERLTLEPGLISSAMQRAWESRKPHNEARVVFVKSALNQLSRLLADQLRSHGNTVDDADQAVLREDLRTSPDVVVALNTAWLPLTPEKLLQDLYARPQWLASLTPSWSDARRALLRRDRDAPFTISDVPLLDEAAELLGEYNAQNAALKREEKLQKKRDIENAENAIRNMQVEGLVHAEDLAAGFAERSVRGTTAEQAAADRTWTYGHIVVDEAQELSAMQWRVLARRCPLRSFTVVGDMAQASSAASARSWQDAVRPLVGASPLGEKWRLEELTVNYRTPAQIAAEAERMAERNHLPITRATAVRESEWPVTTTTVELSPAGRAADPDALGDAVITVIEDDRDIDSRGTVAVIATEATVDALYPALSESFGRDIGLGAQGLNRSIAVLTAQDAKGLEFDAVVVVDPDSILAESTRGASGLYVAMTRPTQRLHLVRPA
ncbi:AAA family ATPase [Agreia sp. Leaf244]|uniref:HelD family protein n=1 Tax=Agreia sp. Leaf244 TaxID=1736305 RepID=UPI0006F912A7|nr:UvrD-helicase domain-containing protein [Agreia sp. Leaf244]KQO06457.1 AAA family ATPase [Agreia sp. Leaf244]